MSPPRNKKNASPKPRPGKQMTDEEIKEMYPLHFWVWDKNMNEIQKFLEEHPNQCTKKDNHGRTPLMLAIALFFKEAAVMLAKHTHEAVLEPDQDGFTAWHEALITRDPELLGELYKVKEQLRLKEILQKIEATFGEFSKVDDFYYEMKMQFKSWVPFLSSFCPSDVYRVYKKGTNVRIDTTLVALDDSGTLPKSIAGKRSFVFICSASGTTFLDIDHQTKTYDKVGIAKGTENLEKVITVDNSEIEEKTKQSVKLMQVDTKDAVIKRAMKGLPYFSQKERTDEISGYICRVFQVSGIYVNQKTRQEHLDFLGPLKDLNTVKNRNPDELTSGQYFSFKDKDIGLRRNMKESKSHFTATIWNSEEFPMQVNNHLLPVLRLLALLNPHFERMLYFIDSNFQLRGFPVQIEIPVYFALSALVTFGNVFGSKEPVADVKSKQMNPEGTAFECNVDESLFQIPQFYTENQ